MAGLYIHVPFCKKKCPYCNFYSVVSRSLRKNYLTTLVHEATHFAPVWSNHEFETLYLGGGTPSLLSDEELCSLFENLKALFRFSKNSEITLEANPEDINSNTLLLWKSMGINRLSIGLQALDNESLSFLERQHSSADAFEKLKLARNAGFSNISVDLIYGIPGLSRKTWLQTLDTLFQFRPEHISAYALTLEENTIYHVKVKRQLLATPPDKLAIAHFHILRHKARIHGYKFYEVSNLCLPGYHSKHNFSYWQGVPYLGLGPSAHSFDGRKRWWNPSSMGEWQNLVFKGDFPDNEILNSTQQFNDYLVTRLRTRKGMIFEDLSRIFLKNDIDLIIHTANQLPKGLLALTSKGIRIPVRNFLLSDGIIRKFILEEP